MPSRPVKVVVLGRATPLRLEELGPRVGEADVASFEARFGHRLPDAYREFLLKYNGGDPVSGEVSGRDDDPSVPYAHGDAVNTLLKLATPNHAVQAYEALLTPGEHPWPLPSDVLPIGSDAGGNLFLLEVGQRGTSVRFLDHERFDAPLDTQRVVADDFLDLVMRFVPVSTMRAKADAERRAEREALRAGPLPPLLEAQCVALEREHPLVREWIRAACLQVFDSKGHFSLHADESSRLVFDLAAWLAWHADRLLLDGSPASCAALLVPWWRAAAGGLGIGGIAPSFVQAWWEDRLATECFERTTVGAHLTPTAEAALLGRLAALGGQRG